MQQRFLNKQAKWLSEEFRVPQLSNIELVTLRKILAQGRPRKVLRSVQSVQNKGMFKHL